MSRVGSAWIESAEQARRPNDFLQALYGPLPCLPFTTPASITNFLLVSQGGALHVFLPLQHPATPLNATQVGKM